MENGKSESSPRGGRRITAVVNSTAVDALHRIAAQADNAIDVAEAALVLASFDHPATDLQVYRDHLKALVDAVSERAGAMESPDSPTPEDIATVLSDVIAGDFRYTGDEDTYEDLDNANLMRVIERRKGLPVALGILYLFAARSQGWSAAGLNFPGHFLIRFESVDGRRVIVDPFHNGRIMETPALRELLKVFAGQAEELESGHYKVVSNRDVLIRLQNNVKERRLKLGMHEEALDALEHMKVLSPGQAAFWREAGVMQMRLGRLKHAVESFEGFMARAPDGPDRRKIASVIQELRERLH